MMMMMWMMMMMVCREAIIAMINSYIGNALLELNEPRKALDYFKMEKSLADQ
jgi:hypothetical protein